MSTLVAPPAEPKAKRSRVRSSSLSHSLAGYLFVLPFMLIFVGALVIPLGYAAYLSLFRETLIGGKRLVDDAAGTRFSIRDQGLRAWVGARQVMALDARISSAEEWITMNG